MNDATLIALATQNVNPDYVDLDTLHVEVDQRSPRAWTVSVLGKTHPCECFGTRQTHIVYAARCAGKTPAKAYARVESVLRRRIARLADARSAV